MKRIIIFAAAVLVAASCCNCDPAKGYGEVVEMAPIPEGIDVKNPVYTFVEATDLTMTGQLFPENPCPYHRIDTVRFKGFTKSENGQVRSSAGMAVRFKTDSRKIVLKCEMGMIGYPDNSTGFSARGFDLYIKDKNGEWLYAETNCGKRGKEDEVFTLIDNLPAGVKECQIYFPLFSEVKSMKVGVYEGNTLEPLESELRHRVLIHGSSFTHGTSTTRSGMTYPKVLERRTGIQFISLGCSGNCKMQPYFAAALAEADVDAFVFDSFSNPTIAQIDERLFPFIETIQAAHPGKPLIFQKTIYRESRNFNMKSAKDEADRMVFVDSLMNVACKKYKDVYYVTTTCATNAEHSTSQDATHPTDYGYSLWAASIQKPVLKILKKYGIQ